MSKPVYRVYKDTEDFPDLDIEGHYLVKPNVVLTGDEVAYYYDLKKRVQAVEMVDNAERAGSYTEMFDVEQELIDTAFLLIYGKGRDAND
jgi:hypothetical protein